MSATGVPFMRIASAEGRRHPDSLNITGTEYETARGAILDKMQGGDVSDYYHELSGSPEVTPAHESAVEKYLAAFPAELRKQTLEMLPDLLDGLAPDRDDEDATAAFEDAVAEFRKYLTPAPHWCPFCEDVERSQ